MKKLYFLIIGVFVGAAISVGAATNVSLTKDRTLQYLNYIADSFAIGQTSTSTFAKFYVSGSTTVSGTGVFGGILTVPSIKATSSATSTFSGGIDMAQVNVTGSATNTMANGINLTNGCISRNGTCIGGTGGGSGTNWFSGTGTAPMLAQFDSANSIRSATTVVTSFIVATSSATSTFVGDITIGNTTVRGSGNPTSTMLGINLTQGCFAINGTCVSFGGGSGASSTLLSDGNNWTGLNKFTGGLISLGSSTIQTLNTTGLTISGLSGVLKASGGVVSGGATTSDIPEGTNSYWTSLRATTSISSLIAATTTTALAEGTNLYYTVLRFANALAGTTTDALTEGSNNLYYTSARFNTAFDQRFAATSTTGLVEGTNLYYTSQRVRDLIQSADGSLTVSTSSLTINGVPYFDGVSLVTDVPNLSYNSGMFTVSGLTLGSGGMVSYDGGGNRIVVGNSSAIIGFDVGNVLTLDNYQDGGTIPRFSDTSSVKKLSFAESGGTTTISWDPSATSTFAGAIDVSALKIGSGDGCLQGVGGFVRFTGVNCGSGSGGGSDVNWTFFNNSGIRVSTTTNQVLIGGTATNSTARLEIVGSTTQTGAFMAGGEVRAPFFTGTSSATSSFGGPVQIAMGGNRITLNPGTATSGFPLLDASSTIFLQSTTTIGSWIAQLTAPVANITSLFGTNAYITASTTFGSINTSSSTLGTFLGGNGTTSALAVRSLVNCDTIDTDINGNLKCGTDANSGGGSSNVATSSFAWTIYKSGNSVVLWDNQRGEVATTQTTLNDVFSKYLINAATSTLNEGKTSVYIKSGYYPVNSTTTITGGLARTGAGSSAYVSKNMIIMGDGASTTIALNANVSAFNFIDQSSVTIEHLGFAFSSAAPQARALTASSSAGFIQSSVRESQFHDLQFFSSTTGHTAYAIDFREDFRTHFSDLDFKQTGECIRSQNFYSDAQFINGDNTYQRIFCETNMSNSVAFAFIGQNGQVNQNTFSDVNGIPNTTNSTFFYGQNISRFKVENFNAEQFATTTSLISSGYNYFSSNKYKDRANAAATAVFYTDANSYGNVYDCSEEWVTGTQAYMFIDRNTTRPLNPNRFGGFNKVCELRDNSGSVLMATTPTSLIGEIRDISATPSLTEYNTVKLQGNGLYFDWVNTQTTFIKYLTSAYRFYLGGLEEMSLSTSGLTVADTITATRFVATSTVSASTLPYASTTAITTTATSTMGDILAANLNGLISASRFVATGSGTSTQLQGFTATQFALSGATSTAASGFNITSGCYAINGTCVGNGGSGTPGGSDTQIQYNSAGSFAGSARFTWNNTGKELSIGVENDFATIQGMGASTLNTTGGSLIVRGGNGNGTGAGGSVTVSGGGTVNAVGGDLYIQGGEGSSGNNKGGDVWVSPGLSAGSGIATVIFDRGFSSLSSTTFAFFQSASSTLGQFLGANGTTSALAVTGQFTNTNTATATFSGGIKSTRPQFTALNEVNCDVKATTDGTQYCGTDATGGGGGAGDVVNATGTDLQIPYFGVGTSNGLVGTDTFKLASTEEVLIKTTANTARLNIGCDSVFACLKMRASAITDIGFSGYVDGDSFLRYTFLGDGSMEFGGGTSVADTVFKRVSSGMMALVRKSNTQKATLLVGTTTPQENMSIYVAGAINGTLPYRYCAVPWRSQTTITADQLGSATVAPFVCNNNYFFDINTDGNILALTSEASWIASGTPVMQRIISGNAAPNNINELAMMKTELLGSATTTNGQMMGMMAEHFVQLVDVGTATTSVNYIFGFSDVAVTSITTSAAYTSPKEGCYIVASSTANWRAVCRRNNVEAANVDIVATSTTVVRFRYSLNQEGFNVYVNNDETARATIGASSIPTSYLRHFIGTALSGGTAAGQGDMGVAQIKLWSVY